MDMEQVVKMEKLCSEARELNNEIFKLQQGLELSKKVEYLEFTFQPNFSISYGLYDVDNRVIKDIQRVCWANLMEVHKNKIRSMLLDMLQSSIDERKDKLDKLEYIVPNKS